MTTESTTGTGTSLSEAASRYIVTVAEKERAFQLQEVNRFVRWFGGDRTVASLNGEEVSNYAERQAQMDTDFASKLEPLRAFLAFVRKEKWNPENLAVGIKIKKSKSRNTGPSQKLKREPVPMTQGKYDELTVELTNLRARRTQVIADVQRAAADKDFKENAPFHAAREQKAHIDGRIMEVEEMLGSAVIIGETKETVQVVCVGDTVVLEIVSSGQEMRYKIVNPKEVSPARGMISTISPIGKAALGKSEGETFEVAAPAGKLQCRIKKIER